MADLKPKNPKKKPPKKLLLAFGKSCNHKSQLVKSQIPFRIVAASFGINIRDSTSQSMHRFQLQTLSLGMRLNNVCWMAPIASGSC